MTEPKATQTADVLLASVLQALASVVFHASTAAPAASRRVTMSPVPAPRPATAAPSSPPPEAPKPLAVADLRSLGRPTIADPASVANDPGQARAGTPDVWDLLQDGDVLEFHGDEDSLGDDYEEAADAYDDAVDGV